MKKRQTENLKLLQQQLAETEKKLSLIDERQFESEAPILIANQINELSTDLLQSKNVNDLKDVLGKIRNTIKTLNTLRRSGEINDNEYLMLMGELKKISNIASVNFRMLGGEIKKGRLISPDEKLKAKAKAKIKEHGYTAVGTFFSSLTDSPLLMMIGAKIDEYREKKAEEMKEEDERAEDLLRKIYGTKLERKAQVGDIDEDIYEKRSEIEDGIKKTRLSTENVDDNLNEIDDMAKDYFEKVKESTDNIKENIDSYNKQLEELKDSFDFGEIAKDIGVDEGIFEGLKSDIKNIGGYKDEEKQDEAIEEGMEMVEGNLGDLYDLTGDIKDILKLWYKDWKNINSEEQVGDRDRWLEKLYESSIETHNIMLGNKKRDDESDKDNKSFLKRGKDFLPAASSFLKKHGAKIAKVAGGVALVTAAYNLSKGLGKEEEYLEGGGTGGIKESASAGVANLMNKTSFGLVKKDVASEISDTLMYGPLAVEKRMVRRFNSIHYSRDMYDLAIAEDEDAKFYKKFLKKYFPNEYSNLEKIKKWMKTEKGKKWLERKGKPQAVKNLDIKIPVTEEVKKKEMAVVKPTALRTDKEPASSSTAVEIRKGVDLNNVNQQLKQNFFAMAEEYQSQTGKQVPINSAYRTSKQQQALFDKKNTTGAAKPGRSMHEYGYAIDTDTAVANDLNSKGLLDKYGISQPYKEPIHGISEKHHLELAGIDKESIRSNKQPNIREVGEPSIDFSKFDFPDRKKETQINNKIVNSFAQNTIVIPKRDYQFFIDDMSLRVGLNNGVS